MSERIEVDGQTFEAVRRPGTQNVYDIIWVAGKHAGDYGFSTAAYGGAPLDSKQLEQSIIDFLDRVDPTTGFGD